VNKTQQIQQQSGRKEATFTFTNKNKIYQIHSDLEQIVAKAPKIIQRKIKDEHVLLLIKSILKNGFLCKGMPLGNLTSQFFANVYLNELDYFVKHKLKAKYYL
jgi:hypothetical protein